MDRQELFRRFCDLVEAGVGRREAAKQIGRSWATIRRWIEADPDLAAMLADAEEAASEPVERALYAAAVRGEPWAVQLWLKHRAKDRWQEDQQPQVQVNVQPPAIGDLERLYAEIERQRQLVWGEDPVVPELPEPSAPEVPDPLAELLEPD